MTMIYDKSAKKKATNLSVNSDLLLKAKALHINISSCLEQTLEEKVREKQIEQWELENQDAINEYNEDVARNGVFSDGLRGF